ncbi:MAG: hypothetical protein U1E60_25435 [Reyranellaceae bacterium]
MAINPRRFIDSAAIGELTVAEATEASDVPPLDLDKLPKGVVSGPTLIDFSNVPDVEVRAGVSLSMLFASRVAAQAAKKTGGDEDDWLAAYTSSLSSLGFATAGTALVKSSFRKTGLEVHKAIIPFLTVAFGGAAVGPIILAALQNLQSIDEGKPWIQLFESEAKRFEVREMHFAAVSSSPTDTAIRYAIARLNVDASVTSVLFFKISKATADFDSATTTMSVNNSLMAATEPDLRLRLGQMTKRFIIGADLGDGT